jgi:selenocysteine lyase/cysteine desulfurase
MAESPAVSPVLATAPPSERQDPAMAVLSEGYGIGVRNGRSCAHPFIRRLLGVESAGCSGSPDTAVRAGIGVGTTTAHVDRLVAALGSLADR